jgi:hypothetical protein
MRHTVKINPSFGKWCLCCAPAFARATRRMNMPPSQAMQRTCIDAYQYNNLDNTSTIDHLSPTFVTSTQHVVKRTLASESPGYPLRCRTRSQYVTCIVNDGENKVHLRSSPYAEDTSGVEDAPGKSCFRGCSVRRVEARQGPFGGKGQVNKRAGPGLGFWGFLSTNTQQKRTNKYL